MTLRRFSWRIRASWTWKRLQDAVADEGAGGRMSPAHQALLQDVRHLPHVVGDALLGERGVSGAQDLEGRGAPERTAPRSRPFHRAASPREAPPLLGDGHEDDEADEDEQEEAGAGDAPVARAVDAPAEASPSETPATEASSPSEAAPTATPSASRIAAAPAGSCERDRGIEHERPDERAGGQRFHADHSTRSELPAGGRLPQGSVTRTVPPR